jgi:hypothetical protein
MFNAFNVSADARGAFNRCVGQQVPVDAKMPQFAEADNAAITSVQPSTEVAMQVTNGYQTLKASGNHSNLDIYIPLLFWFNRDPRLAVPSVALPHANRYINVNLASLSQMFEVFLNASSTTPVFTGGSVSTLELWVNNIFVNPEVHDIFIKRIGFSLIRVHREHVQQVTQSSGRVLLSNLKWPIECMFVGFRRTFYETNATTSAANNQMWHRFAHPSATATAKFHGVSSVSGGAFAAVPPSITITTWHRICASLTISAHGVPLYNVAPGMMLDSYIPYRFSSTGVSTDKDGLGAMMVNFCLFPGAYQPSGHINVSRAREFYLEYVSAYDEGGSTYIIGTGGAIQTGAATCTLVVIASAINFLLISDGSAVLRYTT